VLFPDRPSLLRKTLLAPATLLYAGACAVHWAVRGRWREPASAHLPVIVIGGLRVGGAGKTPVALELATRLARNGYRAGVLMRSIGSKTSRTGGSSKGKPSEEEMSGASSQAAGFEEVSPGSDWRKTSDEAVMAARGFAREFAGGRADAVRPRVFVARDRDRARAALARMGALDVLVSDDGLMDARLVATPLDPRVLRIALIRPGEAPGFWDRLPAGAWRLPASFLDRSGSPRGADIVLREGVEYTRETHPPAPGFPQAPPVWSLTGLGDPARFEQSLRQAGWKVAGGSRGPDHGLPDLARAVRAAREAGAASLVCSAKDEVKLEALGEVSLKLTGVGETVRLSEAFLSRVTTFLAPPTS
jgi:tetraacyldisaccharide 4'-kinase